MALGANVVLCCLGDKLITMVPKRPFNHPFPSDTNPILVKRQAHQTGHLLAQRTSFDSSRAPERLERGPGRGSHPSKMQEQPPLSRRERPELAQSTTKCSVP